MRFLITQDFIKRTGAKCSPADMEILSSELNKFITENLNDAKDEHIKNFVCVFLAQIYHESSYFTKFEENLNYSAPRLLVVFPKYFTKATAALYAGNPKKIGSRVYANRMGNGSEASMEGYLYRGRSPIHLTGKSNYAKFGTYINEDIVSHPDLLKLPKYGTKVALAFFKYTPGLMTACFNGDIKVSTKIINGGYNGIEDRTRIFNNIKKIINS